MSNDNNMSITDIADALGVSKTTVSRAISGKGRVGETTKRKILDYIDECGYSIPIGQIQDRTYNIGFVFPMDTSISETLFYHRCMLGIAKVGARRKIDVLAVPVGDNDMVPYKRIMQNHKVDAVVLGRTLEKDPAIEFLQECGVPFVAIGSSYYDNVVQVDNDHIAACSELIGVLAMKGIKSFALFGGDSSHIVNRTRLEGYKKGHVQNSLECREDMIFMDADSHMVVDDALDKVIAAGIECIICMDDGICATTLDYLDKRGMSVPKDIRVASLYSGTLIDDRQPGITSLRYDSEELGREACRLLTDMLDGKNVPMRSLLGYEVLLKGSTY